MNSFSYYSPTKVIFGKDAEEAVGQEILKWGGRKVLLHTGGASAKKSGLLDRVEASLKAAGLDYVALGGVVPNPRVSLVRQGIALCREEGVDFILAVGGGSVIDSAKAIAIGVHFDGDIWDIYERKGKPAKVLPTGNILTLAAAGSETSKSSVLTNEEGWIKKGYGSDLIRPRFTMMNPELTYTLPPYQTASGVVDILMHTFERYFSFGGVNEMSDRIAEALMKTAIEYGKKAYDNPTDYEARSEVMWAGSLSHNDLTGLGRKGDWATHQMEHELSGYYDVAHGAGLAAVWASWARYAYKADVARFARFARVIWGVSEADPEAAALEGIRKTEAYFVSIGMPVNITDLVGKEVPDDIIEEMAEKCTYFGRRKIGGLVVLDKPEIIEIYKAAR